MRTTSSALTLVLAASMLLPAAARPLGAQGARHPGRAVGMTAQPAAPHASTEPARRQPDAPSLAPPAPPAMPAMPAPMMITGITSYTLLDDGRARADFGGAERLLHRCPSPYYSYVVYYGRPWDPPASFIDRPPVQAPPMGVATRPSSTGSDPRIASMRAEQPQVQGGAQPVYVSVGTMCYYLDPAGRFTVLRF